ncbi:hypothetical protein ACPWT1_03020 [Ramlibacter sp. MMS24-I3-19]|uniref:hypothetical protein n=1 Tax=Ramlibacter sp. MMS24-I3-19 TaxID=3416606 RepID=UPI003D0627F9
MSEVLFPRALCAATLGELAAWTSVADLLAAARILEGRTLPEDQPSDTLCMPLEHDEGAFRDIFAILLGYLIEGYSVPQQKISVARMLDRQVSPSTAAQLEALRFKPTVRTGASRSFPEG